MRRLKIKHTTLYEYSNSVRLQPHKLLLRPREGHDIRIESSQLTINPACTIKWHRDVYDNSVAIATFNMLVDILSIVSEVIIINYEDRPLDFLVADYAVNFPFRYDPQEQADLGPYLLSTYPEDHALLGNWLRQFWQPDQVIETYILLDTINKTLAGDFFYAMREEPGVQRPAATLAIKTGSCRDYATLFIEACRYLGLAARFVSGYLHSPSTVQGYGSTHAWAEVYLPGAGWRGFDPTGGQVVGNGHIAVAVSRHPESIPPVSGAFVSNTPQSPLLKVTVQVAEL